MSGQRPYPPQCSPSTHSLHGGIDLGALVSVLCGLEQVNQLDHLGSNGPLFASAGRCSLFHCLFGRDAIRSRAERSPSSGRGHGIIADGLRRHSQSDPVTSAFPEFFRGEPDRRLALNSDVIGAIVDGIPNRLEQAPQSTQGWTVTRVWRILRQCGAVDPGAACTLQSIAWIRRRPLGAPLVPPNSSRTGGHYQP
jgi:hypothetical protein